MNICVFQRMQGKFLLKVCVYFFKLKLSIEIILIEIFRKFIRQYVKSDNVLMKVLFLIGQEGNMFLYMVVIWKQFGIVKILLNSKVWKNLENCV